MKEAEEKPAKSGRSWTKSFEDAEKASESLPAGFKGVATILRTITYKIADETKRFRKYFKEEWNTKDPKLGHFHKPWLVFKYSALLTAGALSCVPGFSAAVGFAGGIIAGITSANRNSAGLIKTVISAIYGGWTGLSLGWIPVIGPGMACGITKGTIEGLQDTWNTSKAPTKGDWLEKIKNYNNNLFDSIGIVVKRVGTGILKGLIPVIGLALVEAKLGRTSQKTLKERSSDISVPGLKKRGISLALGREAREATRKVPTSNVDLTGDRVSTVPHLKKTDQSTQER